MFLTMPTPLSFRKRKEYRIKVLGVHVFVKGSVIYRTSTWYNPMRSLRSERHSSLIPAIDRTIQIST